MDLIKTELHLPANIEALVFERIVKREMLKAYLAKVRASELTGVTDAKRSGREDAQDLADYLLDVDVRLGELLAATPPRFTRTNHGEITGEKTLPPHVSKAVSHQAQTLSANKETVEKVKAEARESGMVVTSEKVYKLIKAEESQAKVEIIRSNRVANPDGKYDVIVIDPPWPMEKIERDCRPNQHGLDYPTMTEDELTMLNIPAADNCHLFLWTTNKFLPMAFRLADFWAFRYVFLMTWHKPGGFQPVGLPQYNAEFCLYARKGSPRFIDTKAFNVCFDAPRGEHSEKPDFFYQTIARVTEGLRLDMFGRRAIDDFVGWGNQAL